MSNADTERRALSRLAETSGAVLAPDPRGKNFGVFPKGDRRRRPQALVASVVVKAWASEGSIEKSASGDCYMLTGAGRAKLARMSARDDEEFLAQHRPIVPRASITTRGSVATARGYEPNACVKRLAALRDGRGVSWFSSAELAAAAALRADWERSQIGLVGGSDWSAPPRGANARGPSNRQEALLAARCDANARFNAAMDGLAPQLRRVVDAALLREQGLEALENAEGWPARSAKIALKLALAQLSVAYARAEASA